MWRSRHFVDLRLLDIVCCLIWLGSNHYAVFMLDLWGRALHYYDSIKSHYPRDQAIAYAVDILLWAETLGKLLNVAEFRDATTWSVHYHGGGPTDPMPRQGCPTPVTKARPKGGWNVGVDCALFAASATTCAARGQPFAFQQAHMPSLRRQAAFMILHWWQSKGEGFTAC
jgi:hypothetical protein